MADESSTAAQTPRAGWGTRALKWVAAATAVISLVLGIQQITSKAGDRMRRSREAGSLLQMARQQASRSEFTQAWKSLDQAAPLASDDDLDAARVDVAFAWLQESRPGPGNPFSVITDAVTPALDRALIKAQGPRRADILAHQGWITFLRSRDGVSGDPARQYQAALDVDKNNAFANAMWGHWLMWHGANITAARSKFQAALDSGQHREFVRRLQLASLTTGGGERDVELMRVVNQMRGNGEMLDTRTADYAYWLFTIRYRPSSSAAPDAPWLPVPDLEQTFDYIVQASEKAGASPEMTAQVRERVRGTKTTARAGRP